MDAPLNYFWDNLRIWMTVAMCTLKFLHKVVYLKCAFMSDILYFPGGFQSKTY